MKVAILGGGFCGSMVAKRLDRKKDLEVFLIDEKEYFEYYPSLPKLITDPEYHEKIIKRYSQFLDNAEIISERVVTITPEYFSTDERRSEFDILVVALGARYPIYLDDTRDVFTLNSGKDVKKLSRRVKKADTILIVGGGLIGTEAAAELASKTDKKIVLVHSHKRLIERNPPMASFFAERYLRKNGVKLIFGEKVIDREHGKFETDNGREIDANVCIWSAGLGYDTGIFQRFDESSFAENGSLKVNKHLQVKGYSTIFAGGDITDIDEEKTGHNADSHSRIISENIVRSREGRSLRTYRKLKTPLVISLGDINGLISFSPVGIPGPIPALIKYLLEKGALLRL